MFVLVQMKDTIRISPEDAHLLQQDPLHLLRVEINNKYTNKVIHDVGLCTLVHSILSYDDPQLFPSDPGPYIRCTFRLVVFQPQEGQIISGKIISSTINHILISIDLFSHIIIEANSLPVNTEWDAAENVWKWENEGNSYYYDLGMVVRLRVIRTAFSPSTLTKTPTRSLTDNSNITSQQGGITNDSQQAHPKAQKHGYVAPITPQPLNQQRSLPNTQEDATRTYQPPYIVYGSMEDIGLGPVEWWD
jgi:DNA-directed RNA polymerase III subunit RPC8